MQEKVKDDTISRQAAIDEVKRLHDVAWTNWKETKISANTMIDALKDLPSAQPKLELVDITDISEIFEPKFTEEEIQMMQELEAAEIEKAYQLWHGRHTARDYTVQGL